MAKTRIAVNGSSGRMGKLICDIAARESGQFEVAGCFDATGQKLSFDALKKIGQGGVLIDFSSPAGTLEAVSIASAAGWGLVVGTTGLEAKEYDALKKASSKIPVLVSSNMSMGVNLVIEVLEMLSKKAPEGFNIDITEAHHVHKKDAPSGTAIMLLNAIGGPRGWDEKKMVSEKARIHSIREGEIIGDHSVLFAAPEETIEIKHHARSRDIFAVGALYAATRLFEMNPGYYTMRDVLKK